MRHTVLIAACGMIIAGPLAGSTAAAQTAPTGRFGAVMEYDPSAAPARTVYRPRDLAAASRIPIVAWGNGGCAADGGAGARPFLLEVASQGFVILAAAKPGPDPQPRPNAPQPPQPAGPPAGADATESSELTAAIDWAIAENSRRGSVYFGKLDPRAIAVMGHSCGGLQALKVSVDPRVVTSMIWNSGIYTRPGGRSGVRIDKEDLKLLHAPVAYIQGGPKDIAYENAVDDVGRIDRVPVLMAESPVGHGGTFAEANGGAYARLATAWLNWRLKNDRRAASQFIGEHCGLCTSGDWKITRKRMN